MFIKNIVVDGFKSYGQRTEIQGFDRLFNAITGLNGSGKSNILDSICFVLGLSNMSIARVSNLREIIYKNGQTGVTKAEVTITFDNKDKERSPSGYEHYDEIVIRREVNLNSRTKYCINGFTATNSQVSDLFHSVQLNINNPHFLIMQGRITKVLNMKPHEILAMVEESTGVSMYESKKKHTQAVIEKKDLALRQIDALIKETINPKLGKLQSEQSGLLEYKKVVAELEHLNKKYIAFKYITCENLCQDTGNRIKEKQAAIENGKSTITELEEKVSHLENSIKTVEREKDQECGGVLVALEEKLKGLQMQEAQKSGALSIEKENQQQEKKNTKQAQKQYDDDRGLLEQRQKELDAFSEAFQKLTDTCKADEDALNQAQKDFEAVSAGLSRAADGEVAASLADQLLQAKNSLSSLETECTKAEMKTADCVKQLKEKEARATREKDGYEKQVKTIESKEKELDVLKGQLIDFNEEEEQRLINDQRELSREVAGMQDEIQNLEYRCPQAKFDMNILGVDNNKIAGVVCNLFKVRDQRTYTALELAAGSKLYNVVVDNEETAKKIFERGPKKRCTLLPLNKIEGRDVDRRALQNAERLVGKENVSPAISLIDFDPQYAHAMKYVFGDTLVCPDMDIAQKVAFAKDVRKRTVTLDGEVFDPSGTLYGGHLGGRGNILAQTEAIKEKREALMNAQRNLTDIRNRLIHIKQDSERYHKVKKQIDLLSHEISLLKDRVKQTNQHQLLEDIAALKETIEANKTLQKSSVQRKKELDKVIRDLQYKLENSKSVREAELKEAKDNLQKTKKAAEKSRNELEQKRQYFDSLRLEIEDLKKSTENCSEQLNQRNEAMEKCSEAIQRLSEELEVLRTEIKEAEDEIKEQKRKLKGQNEEIAKMQKQKDKLLKQIEENRLAIKKIDHEISQIESASKDAAHNLKVLLKKYSWINEDKHLFGNENEGYGFKDESLDAMSEKIQKLQSTKNALGKTVNMRANIMLSDKEKEAEELRKKRKTIENDRVKLIQYMEEVDQKKKKALYDAWKKINKDFGDIFSTLLPGTSAKLDAPENQSVLDGLEVKVAFGGVWKESLTELSGGQRSLVALSLILALLLFNPAPIYILDEVDAALDQSHTQNIGLMIKKHFSKSQFIIVSLKDDMFNNANVLYKTKFVDGNSTVSRFARN